MIHRIYSDLPTFKEIRFTQGLNVLLAEKSAGATERHTRNRAGKSSMVEIVHFLLGSSTRKSLFKSPAIENYEFSMELDLDNRRTSVHRVGANASPPGCRRRLLDMARPTATQDGRHWINNSNWRIVLGALMFGTEDYQESWTPSFRSMISYFARRERAGGMHVPVKQSEKQATGNQQVNLSYLLGLDWTIPMKWQVVRDRERTLAELRKSLKGGLLGQVIEKASTLKTQVLVSEDRVKQQKMRSRQPSR
ncbi:MAG: hypothetical protein R3C29_17800 [Dehalococcoidia bacterium]